MRGKRLPVVLVVALTSCSTPSKPEQTPPDARSDQPSENSCVCTLSKDELADREKWLASFASGIEAVSSLPDGVECRFPDTHEWASRAFELVEKERACCSSLTFELRFEPENGPILLRIRGSKEAADFLRSRLTVAKKAEAAK